MRAPARRRLRMSRPALSVPSKCTGFGDWNAIARLDWSGLKGTRSGPIVAATIITSKIARATTPSGFDSNRFRTPGRTLARCSVSVLAISVMRHELSGLPSRRRGRPAS